MKSKWIMLLLSVTQLCPTLRDPMDCSMPGLPVPHHLIEFAQVHVHCIGDAVQPSHPLMPSSPSSLNLSQHQGHLFASDDQNTGASAAVLPVNIQDRSPLRLTGLISLLSKELSGVFSSIQFEGINSLVFCLLYGLVVTVVHDRWGNLDHTEVCWQSDVSAFQHTD